MAANLTPLPPHSAVRAADASSSAGHQSSDPHRKNWWTPLFGWSSEPDYITTDKIRTNNSTLSSSSSRSSGSTCSDSDSNQRSARSRISSVKFTDEKARKLRMMTVETESFHEMYHSAIASRFASDFSDRSGL